MFSLLSELIRELFVFVGMVAPKSCFPQPLSPEREAELARELKNGSTEARNELIEHNLRLVAHIAKKYANRERSLDDLISIGTIGLIKAIGTFDPDKAKSVAAYASRCVENEILMSIRSEKKHCGEVSLEEPIGVDRDGNEITLSDVIASDESSAADTVILNSNGRALRAAVNEVLTARERCVIELRYGLIDGRLMPQREVGKQLCISRSYVSRIEKKALEKLNACLTGKV
ncbi:MAG: RNA polymerase sporulation sigma factor SigK [Clostridia bacterium]|nr:RNA polymerase sporulation sigma factor SigK [Clostridia bacterium]